MMQQIFYGMQILYDNQWLIDHAVIVEDGKIKGIIPTDMMQHHLPANMYHYPADYYLAPGFIDLHIHGAAGADVMDASEDALKKMAEALASEGVTGFLATTMTANLPSIEAALENIANYTKTKLSAGAALLGVHLEGPFIAKEKMGAQLPDYIITPNIALFKQWQALSGGNIKLVTLAPELPGMLPFIAALKELQIIISIGHTNATYDETVDAIQAGCTQGTHLFNAMRGLHQREPGAAAALLLSAMTSVEVIADGLHLHPAMLSIALKMKGAEQLLLVTDAMRAKCLGDGHYDLGGQQVHVKDGKATIANDILAGSTLRMPQAIKNMMVFTGCTLIDAINMASLQPAEKLGLANRKGKIAVHYDADFAVLNAHHEVVLTIRAGVEVFRAS